MKAALLLGCIVLAPIAVADDAGDPMRPPRPPVNAAAREAAPVLSAIMGTPGARIAIFNGQLVRGGGRVGEYAIEAVFEDGVRYRRAGVTQDLYLPHTSAFKKPSAAEPAPPNGVQ